MASVLTLLGWCWANRQLVGWVAAGVALVVAGLWFTDAIGDRREADVRLGLQQDTDRRTTRANAADDAARRCNADPACRVRPDQYRRD